MIKSITITNDLNESIKLELASPVSAGLAVLAVEGLGPPKANINVTEFVTSDGSLYNSARASSRNILLYLKFLWNPTIEHSRQLSYKFFPIKKLIKLTIETDQRVSEVYGYVESNEPNIFSNSEGTQISILCPDSYIQSVGTRLTTLSSVLSEFEFPFGNESLADPLLTMTEVQEGNAQNIEYTGDAGVGIDVTMTATGDVTMPMLYNSLTRELMQIDTVKLATLTGNAIIAGDVIEITTTVGNKRIVLIRNGVHTNILNCLVPGYSWFKLERGSNVFAFTVDTGETVFEVVIRNKTVYAGV